MVDEMAGMGVERGVGGDGGGGGGGSSEGEDLRLRSAPGVCVCVSRWNGWRAGGGGNGRVGGSHSGRWRDEKMQTREGPSFMYAFARCGRYLSIGRGCEVSSSSVRSLRAFPGRTGVFGTGVVRMSRLAYDQCLTFKIPYRGVTLPLALGGVDERYDTAPDERGSDGDETGKPDGIW